VKSPAQRISSLEQRKSSSPRRIHIVTAVDEPDRDRKMADLMDIGVVGARDGFLCLMGKPLVH
jgi:hypothetical protein